MTKLVDEQSNIPRVLSNMPGAHNIQQPGPYSAAPKLCPEPTLNSPGQRDRRNHDLSGNKGPTEVLKAEAHFGLVEEQ